MRGLEEMSLIVGGVITGGGCFEKIPIGGVGGGSNKVGVGEKGLN